MKKNDGAIFSGTFNWFFSTIYELPLILTFSENILFASFHFLNKHRHVTYQMKGNGA